MAAAARDTPVGGPARARARGVAAGRLVHARRPAARDEDELVAAFDTLVDVVAEGEPALLYVGNAVLPRHVVLVLPGDGDRMLDVYDPGTGRVDHLRRDTVVERRLRLSGWDVPWVAVRPVGLRTVRAASGAPALGPAPA